MDLASVYEGMQALLVQLLQQLHGSKTTDDKRLQWLLLDGCCNCLQNWMIESGAANHNASCRYSASHNSFIMTVMRLSACVELVAILLLPRTCNQQPATIACLLSPVLWHCGDLSFTDEVSTRGYVVAECHVLLSESSEQSHNIYVDLQAIVTAVSDWIAAWEIADFDWLPPRSKLQDPFVLVLGVPKLTGEAVLCDLTSTIICYLDSQQKWHEFAQRGLRCLLVQLCASMRGATELSAEQYHASLKNGVNWHFNTLTAAGWFCSCLLSPVFQMQSQVTTFCLLHSFATVVSLYRSPLHCCLFGATSLGNKLRDKKQRV